jgi:hypothetical protein
MFADSRSREKILISKKVHVEGTDKEEFLSLRAGSSKHAYEPKCEHLLCAASAAEKERN